MTYQRFDWDYRSKKYALELDTEEFRLSIDGTPQVMRYADVHEVYFEKLQGGLQNGYSYPFR